MNALKINTLYKLCALAFAATLVIVILLAPKLALAAETSALYAQTACENPRQCDTADQNGQSTESLNEENANSEKLKSAFGGNEGGYTCGGANGSTEIPTRFNFGCNQRQNAITDFFLAITRFLSVGVGLMLIVGTIIAGIQFTMSRGDPNATAAAIKKLIAVGIALVTYVFLFALLNYLVPGGLFL